jgi:hypothetical protein
MTIVSGGSMTAVCTFRAIVNTRVTIAAWTMNDTALDAGSRLNTSGSIAKIGREAISSGKTVFEEAVSGKFAARDGHAEATASRRRRLDLSEGNLSCEIGFGVVDTISPIDFMPGLPAPPLRVDYRLLASESRRIV